MGANAQTTVPTFTAGQVLTADQQNQSARTGVPVFADSSARDAAFGGAGEKTLAEGQLAYLEDSNIVQYYDGSSWATVGPSTSGVIQVKSTLKTDTFQTTSSTFVDVTGVSVSITPTSASNLVFVIVTGNLACNSASDAGRLNLVRDSTAIAQSTGGGGANQSLGFFTASATSGDPFAISVLDSPATTSATTYKLQAARLGSSTVSIGRYAADANYPSVTTITVFEVTP